MAASISLDAFPDQVFPATVRRVAPYVLDVLEQNRNHYADMITAEMGKPHAEALGEVRYGASYVEWFAEEAKRIYGDVIPNASSRARTIVLKQPIGVCAAITPWNFPNAMIARKAGGLTLVPVNRGSITEKAVAVGQIEPRIEFHVKSKISGIVRRCFVEVGDKVTTGDPLFEIAPDPTPQELLNVDHRVRSAEASFGKARADYERGVELHQDGLLSKGDLDALKESFELAQVSVEQARDNRELTRQGIVSGGVTEVERRAVRDAALNAGARWARLIEEIIMRVPCSRASLPRKSGHCQAATPTTGR